MVDETMTAQLRFYFIQLVWTNGFYLSVFLKENVPCKSNRNRCTRKNGNYMENGIWNICESGKNNIIFSFIQHNCATSLLIVWIISFPVCRKDMNIMRMISIIINNFDIDWIIVCTKIYTSVYWPWQRNISIPWKPKYDEDWKST